MSCCADSVQKLREGGYHGLGEFILVHHAYDVGNGETGGDVRIDVDNDAMRRIAALAAKERVPVLFHAAAEERPGAQAERLIAAFPDTLFIWAHNCGRASAEQTAIRLRRFPNLMCDLGHMFNGPRTQAGSHTHVLKFHPYRIAIFRVMLAQLAPDVARKIAAENARRVFAYPPLLLPKER